MAVVEFQMESIDLLFCLTKWLFHNSTKEHHGILNGSRLWGPCTMYIPDNTLRSMGCTEPVPCGLSHSLYDRLSTAAPQAMILAPPVKTRVPNPSHVVGPKARTIGAAQTSHRLSHRLYQDVSLRSMGAPLASRLTLEGTHMRRYSTYYGPSIWRRQGAPRRLIQHWRVPICVDIVRTTGPPFEGVRALHWRLI